MSQITVWVDTFVSPNKLPPFESYCQSLFTRLPVVFFKMATTVLEVARLLNTNHSHVGVSLFAASYIVVWVGGGGLSG